MDRKEFINQIANFKLDKIQPHMRKLRALLAVVDRFEHWTLDLLEGAATLGEAKTRIPSVAEKFTEEEIESLVSWYDGCLREYPSRILMLQQELKKKRQAQARKN